MLSLSTAAVLYPVAATRFYGNAFPKGPWGFSLCFFRKLQSATGEVINNSFKPGPVEEQETCGLEKLVKKHENLGAFQKLPVVKTSVELLASAKKRARNVSPSKGISNLAKRERNKGAKQLDALMKELVVPLRSYMKDFPKKRRLHPYECSLIELTLGEGVYEEVLQRVDSLRKKLVLVGKQHASLCAQSVSKREAEERLSEGITRLEEAFQSEANAIDALVRVAKALRAMPVVDPLQPTLCLVGAPNVGKSSLVRVLSSGKPEICNYPFTTKGILMGHIISNHERFQVTDTPGLLKRKDDDRNNLEKLTLAVLSYLPTAVLFVHDLSGDCGTSASDQFVIYKEVKERFNCHLWLDAVSKCDLLPANNGTSDGSELDHYRRFGPTGAVHVSITNGQGIEELKIKVHDLLDSQMHKLEAVVAEEALP